MPAAEHVGRQVALLFVITVEETLLLMAVQRVVGGVEVEGDLRRRHRMGLDKQALDGRCIIADL